MNENLEHALAGMCEDPDCELHMIEVGLHEGTVSDTDLAFFLAGFARASGLANNALNEILADFVR